jgi:hypothetical protein
MQLSLSTMISTCAGVHSSGLHAIVCQMPGQVCRHEFVKSAALCRDSCDAGAPETLGGAATGTSSG